MIPPPDKDLWTYQRCKLVSVIDGDTVVLAIDLGFGISVHHATIRLYGINAAEKNTTAGIAAKNFLHDLLYDAVITLTTIKDKTEKYGRMLGILKIGALDVNRRLVTAGHAVFWDGHGPRPE